MKIERIDSADGGFTVKVVGPGGKEAFVAIDEAMFSEGNHTKRQILDAYTRELNNAIALVDDRTAVPA